MCPTLVATGIVLGLLLRGRHSSHEWGEELALTVGSCAAHEARTVTGLLRYS
jgi:hypothetical protein